MLLMYEQSKRVVSFKKRTRKAAENLHTSLAESPECWNLEFKPVEIFADIFLIFADKLNIFASNLSSMLINI